MRNKTIAIITTVLFLVSLNSCIQIMHAGSRPPRR